MTGYTVHTGSTEQFSEGWDRIFTGETGKRPTRKPSTTAAAAEASKKKPAKPRSKRKS